MIFSNPYFWAFGLLLISVYLCLYRVAKGPTSADRMVAIDILGVILVGFCALMTIYGKRDFYLNLAIAWSLLSFIGTLALAKYLEKRNFDD